MDRTFVNPRAVVGGREVPSIVVVSTWGGKVVITRRDGNRAPLVRRQCAPDLEVRARQVCRDLAVEGYTPVS